MFDTYKDKNYLVQFTFVNSFNDDIEFEITSCEFTEPVEEDLSELSTTKQLLYYLAELFGDNIANSSNQEYLDFIEEGELSDISELQIQDIEEERTYCLNIQTKKLYIE